MSDEPTKPTTAESTTKPDLPETLRLHKLWLEEADGGVCADLRHGDLRGADLRYADLRYADLRGARGFLLLPVGDPRGYSFAHAVLCDGEWRVRAGCRDFSIAEAREHWGEFYKGERWIGDMYLAALDWLENRLASGEVPV